MEHHLKNTIIHVDTHEDCGIGGQVMYRFSGFVGPHGRHASLSTFSHRLDNEPEYGEEGMIRLEASHQSVLPVD